MWGSVGSMTQPRAGASAALLQDGRVLITGGEDATGALVTAELLNNGSSFSTAPPMDVPRSRHISIALQDGRVLVAGGSTTGGGVTNAAEIYDPSSNSWSAISGGMTEARAGHTASLLKDGKVLISGGENSGVASSTLEMFNPATNSFVFVGTLSSARKEHAAAVLLDGRVLIAGGSDGNSPLASIDIYDPESGTLSQAPNLSTPRAGLSATTLLDGKVLLVGGNNGSQDLASAELYNPTTGAFSVAATNLSTPRKDHLAFLLPHNNSVLIVGGTSAEVELSSAELFVPWVGTFNLTGSPAAARIRATGSRLSFDGLLLLAGGENASGKLSSTELYGFATVKSDKADYAPGEIVTITGRGWQPGETVNLALVESPDLDTHGPFTAVADSSGNIYNNSFVPDEHDANILFYVTATGSVSQAQTTFTDSVTSVTITSPTSASPITVTSLPASVTVSFSYITSTTGTTTGQADILAAPTLSNTKNLAPGTHSDSIVVTIPAGTANGSYNVKVTVTNNTGSGSNNKNDNQNAAVIVNVPTIAATNLSVASASGTYGGTTTLSATLRKTSDNSPIGGKTVNFTLNGNAAGSTTTNGSGVATLSGVSLAGINANTYPTGVGASFAGDSGLSPSSGSNVLTVNPRPITVKANAISRVYGDSTPAFSISVTVGSLASGDTLASLGTPSFGGIPANPGVGTYPITVGGLSNANYTITYDNTGVLTVTPRPITVKANDVSRVYGDSTPAFSIVLSAGSLGYSDTVASLGAPMFSTTPANPGVGTHPITVSGLSNANYTITYDNTGILTVTPRPITVKANDVSRVYGDSTPAFSIFLSAGSLGYSDTVASLGTPTFSTTPANPGVGTYPITVSGLSNANYTITYDNTGVLTVTPRPVTVKANDVSRVYGDSTPAFSIFLSVGTLGYSDTPATLGTPSFSGIPANPGIGTYPITVSGLSNANYTITYDNTGILAVTRRSITVKANNLSRVYGDSTPAFSIFLSAGSFGYSDTVASLGTPAFSTTPANPGVGTHPITVSGLSNANYTITHDNTGVLTVTPRPVTVKANDLSRLYGDSTPAFSILLSAGSFGYTDNLGSLGTPTFSTTPANPGVGTHPITVSGLSSPNYTITYDNTGILTVTPRPITIKANDVSRVYGDSTPAFSIFLSAGTFGYSDTAASIGTPLFSTTPANPGVGTYPITVSGLTNANYTITYDNTGILTVTPRPVTVKANDVSRIYGDLTPAFSIFLSVGTLGYGDTLAILGTPSFSGIPTTPGVGTYPITVSALSNANYTIAYDNTGALTVTPRPVSVKATNVSKVYGDSTPAYSIFLSAGSFGYTDTLASLGTPTFATNPASPVNVGNYPITVSGLSNPNYSIAFDNTGSLTITPRPITIKADSISRVYGNPTPGFSISLAVGTLAYSDSLASLGSPAFTTSPVNPAVNVGTYTITVSGLSNPNYSIAFDNTGVLTITPRPITVTAVTDAKIYDGGVLSAAAPTITAGSLAGTDTPKFRQRFDTKNAGSGKTLIPTGSVTDGNNGNNYNVTFEPVNTGKITPLAITVTAVTDTKIYDGNTSSSGVPTIMPGLVGGDTPGFTQAFDSRNAGPRMLIPSGAVNDGNSGLNYAVTPVNVAGSIIPRPLTVSATGVNKFYDGTVAAAVTLSDDRLSGDMFTDGYSNTIFANANVGTWAVTVTGISISGPDAGNYTANTTAATTATIATAPTATTLSSSFSSVPPAMPVAITLTAKVMNIVTPVIPIGSVTFTDTTTGNLLGMQTLDASGQATLTTSALPVGQHLISVTYTPANLNFGASSSGPNTAPVLTITGPSSGDVHAVNTGVNFSASFTDASVSNPSAQWSFDTTASTNGNVSGGTVTGSYTFAAAGVYNVTLTFNDGLGGIAIANTVSSTNAPPNLPDTVVVYDSSAGFVTGGGWINSPAGAYTWNPSLAGKASFGFVSKYQKGATVPTGETEFNYQVANFNFHSASYQWLVVSGSMAQYKGTGTINGSGNYNFLLTALDGTPDGFRLKITDPTSSSVIYDNKLSTDDTMSNQNTQAISGGSIVIHK